MLWDASLWSCCFTTSLGVSLVVSKAAGPIANFHSLLKMINCSVLFFSSQNWEWLGWNWIKLPLWKSAYIQLLIIPLRCSVSVCQGDHIESWADAVCATQTARVNYHNFLCRQIEVLRKQKQTDGVGVGITQQGCWAPQKWVSNLEQRLNKYRGPFHTSPWSNLELSCWILPESQWDSNPIILRYP